MNREFGGEATSLLFGTINCGMMGRSDVEAVMEKLLARPKLDLMSKIRKVGFYAQNPKEKYNKLVRTSGYAP